MNLNKYQKETEKETEKRDVLIIAEISALYSIIRDKSFILSSKIKAKAGDNTSYFNNVIRKKAFAKKVNDTLIDDYKNVDTFSKNIYAEEYRTSYFYAKYASENQGIAKGYKFNLSRYSKEQFQTALNSSMSVIMDNAEKTVRRKVATKQVYTSILEGIGQGLSIDDMNKNIDKVLGFRDSSGKWIADKAIRKQQQYRTRRTLRTEIGRIRKRAEIDQWINEQDIVKSEKRLVAVRDSRTRRQSIQVDGRLANKEGKFKYPDDNYYYPGETYHPEWDIQDREYVITVDPEYPIKNIIERDPKTGKNKVVPYRSFEDYAKDNKLTRNKYNEVLFK